MSGNPRKQFTFNGWNDFRGRVNTTQVKIRESCAFILQNRRESWQQQSPTCQEIARNGLPLMDGMILEVESTRHFGQVHTPRRVREPAGDSI
jgi:hypothetical protein